MTKRVPYLTEERIERDAIHLLAEYEQSRGVSIAAPIPIEDIVEKHLKLTVEFDDLHRKYGLPREPEEGAEILGEMDFANRRIAIDESLDPYENHRVEGRFRFTLAHEGGGHWRLHRRYFIADPAQSSLFYEPRGLSVVCRSSQAKAPIEWQADFYASCLLMPRYLLIESWRERFGNTKARVVMRGNRLPVSAGMDGEMVAAFRVYDQQRDDEALNEFARPFAEQFQVSMIAMRIRLERIGLLCREIPRQRSLSMAP